MLPPTKEEVLASWRAAKRAARAEAAAASEIPAAREGSEDRQVVDLEVREKVPAMYGAKLLTASAAATFVGGLVLGESCMAALGWI